MKKKKNNTTLYSIEIEKIIKNYSVNNKEKKKVFSNLNIKFEKGKIHCILGTSGCGKSTLMRIIAGLEKYEDGKIKFDKNLDSNEIYLAMILQDNNLLPWYTVSKNIEFALKVTKRETNLENTINELLIKHNLIDYKDFYPHELSVGLKQKVALAKTIVTKPSIVLLDEPFCALDFISKSKIHDLFLNEFSQEKFTCILSTHYIEEAIKLGDYIHLLGENNNYKKFKNLLKTPRDKDPKYQEFVDFIINEYK